jgi:quercetin dioxygenase-like cupin family protein
MHTGNLAELKQYDKIKKQSLYKSEPFEVILLTIAKDEVLKPHTSKTDAFIMIIEGDIIFTLEGIDFNLHKDDLCQFKANQLHAVKALTDAALLLIK